MTEPSLRSASEAMAAIFNPNHHATSVGLLGLLLAVAGGGCGSSATNSSRSDTVNTGPSYAAAAPIYRAGQYCTTKLQARYRSFHFICSHNHLRRL